MSEQNSKTVADAVDQNEDQIQQIKDEVGKKYNSQKLTINRVPDESVQKLKDLAYDKFAGDYGMALAYLLEINDLKDQFDQQLAATSQKVVELQSEVQSLRQELVEQEDTDDSKVDTIG